MPCRRESTSFWPGIVEEDDPMKRQMAWLFLLALSSGLPPLAADPSIQSTGTVALDSVAFGTLHLGWELRPSSEPHRGIGLQLRVPAFLLAKGGGLDTAALEVQGWSDLAAVPGWFVRARLATGVVTQTQVWGTFTSWTGKLGLEPGVRGSWGEAFVSLRPEAALVTWARPSSRTAATFQDRYEDGASSAQPQALLLGVSAARLLVGGGAEVAFLPGFQGTLLLGLYPPLNSEIGWMDGFSFGEIPFFLSIGCRFSLP